jgi:transcriptional regulator with GAF, ATPase, and Fis domain
MKSGGKIKKVSVGKNFSDNPKNNPAKDQAEYYKREKNILLNLSDAIIKVREKDDLIKVFASELKGLFYFTHAVISLIDQQNKTYYPFLFDTSAMHIKHRAELPSLLLNQYFLDDPFIEMTEGHDTPTAFLLDEIMDKPGIPAFLQVNYETGIKQAMIVKLKNKMETIGFVLIYSDKKKEFPDEFKNVLHAISPLLSNAVANTIINDEIKEKEFITQTLLRLSNDMVSVREKSDLLQVISVSLKKVIYFTHCVMLGLDEDGKTYHTFLTDPGSRIKEFPEYGDIITRPNPVNDGIFNVASQSEKPLVLEMKSFNRPKAPDWFKLNYSTGAKEILFKMLPDDGKRKHALLLFSDKTNGFDENSFQIIDRIASQLSTAVKNVLANEEILNKEKDKSFLLDFSHEIAAARTKNELSAAIHTALKKLSEVRAYFIRVINEDGNTMSPFMHDDDVFYVKNPLFKELLDTKIPVDKGITGRVMGSKEPVFIDFAEEVRKGNTDHYIEFWKKLGPQRNSFQKMVGTALGVGDKISGILWVITPQINSALLEGICAQISVAISNIQSNEEIAKREEEKSFLLNFSNDIAAVRTKDDLELAINKVFQNVLHIRLTMIRLINDDGIHLTPYIYDKTSAYTKDEIFEKLFSAKLTIHEELTERVLLSNHPVVFNIKEEEKMGNKGPYIFLWKMSGYKNAYGAPLRVGNTDLGTLWLLTNDLNLSLLKGICSQISTAIFNIKANEKILAFQQSLKNENVHLKEEIRTIYNASDIVGNGPEMQRVYDMISLVAPSNSTVLLLGETGTGKELMARALHNSSPRKERLMVKVNCAALPANLIESELFGHEKGAFTGAIEQRIGKFELANKSTLFLDEIGEMPLETQVKLLRVIQERELERVGGKSTIKVDVRIIAATNRNLEEETKAGRFRSDLYYRLNVFPISLPPLRKRVEDIEPLADFFLARYSRKTGRKINAISAKVLKELKGYAWPGNVRELEHMIERSVLLSRESVLTEIQLPKSHVAVNEQSFDISNLPLREVERNYIIETLKRCDGKIAGMGGAAEILDIPSTTLHSKLQKLRISKADYFVKKD